MRLFRRAMMLAIITIFPAHLVSAQDADSAKNLTISVAKVSRTDYGFLIQVNISNTSRHVLFLPQSPYGPKGFPRILSLDAEQWSDGKTNLRPPGQSFGSSLPPRAGYFSIGPCRDVPFDRRWISLAPGATLEDEIPIFDPSRSNFSPSSCTWRAAHLGPTVRLTVTAGLSRTIRSANKISTYTDVDLTRKSAGEVRRQTSSTSDCAAGPACAGQGRAASISARPQYSPRRR